MALKSAVINVMEAAARKASRGLLRDLGEVEQLQVSKKGPADFVSAADLKAEGILREALTKARPDFALLMEEGGAVEGAAGQPRWIVDPLDGTTNFLHGIPHFGISIALEENGELVAGVIYDPTRDELYRAERGGGAWLNDRRLRVSGRTDLGGALFATGIPFKGLPNHDPFLRTLAAVMPRVAGVRRYGSASLDLAYVAAGRYDGFWEFGLNPWDVAAGILLVREAGGFVTEIGGRAYRLGAPHILAANDALHRQLDKILREAADSR